MKLKISGTVTIGQGIVFAAYFFLCLAWIKVTAWIVFPLTLACGLLGGWGYLFSVYRLMDSRKVSNRNKEILLNILMIMADTGALLATGFILVLSNTILKV